MAITNRPNPPREIAERAAKRFTGRNSPVVTARDTGRAGAGTAPSSLSPLNDATTGAKIAIYDIDSYDDADAIYGA